MRIAKRFGWINSSYLLFFTTNRPFVPFATTQVHQLLPHRYLGIPCRTVIWTWQLSAEERLFPAMSSDRAAALFVYLGFSFSNDECVRKERKHAETREDRGEAKSPHRRDNGW
jgi:hypothetical protein